MSLIEMIKEQDEKFARSILDLENFVCTLGRLVDAIIDKDLGLCVDYKLVEDAVAMDDEGNVAVFYVFNSDEDDE